MNRIILLLVLLTMGVFAQQGNVKRDQLHYTPVIGWYDPVTDSIFNANEAHPLPVSGSFSITGSATATSQDSLNAEVLRLLLELSKKPNSTSDTTGNYSRTILTQRVDTLKNQVDKILGYQSIIANKNGQDSSKALLQTIASSINKYYYKADSLRYGDSIKIWYANGNYLFGFVKIIDTSSGTSGHLADSVIVEVQDSLTAKWTSLQMGLKDMYTGTIGTATIIMGDDGAHGGLTKCYQVNMPYPRTIRARRLNVSNIATRTTYIEFTGRQ